MNPKIDGKRHAELYFSLRDTFLCYKNNEIDIYTAMRLISKHYKRLYNADILETVLYQYKNCKLSLNKAILRLNS